MVDLIRYRHIRSQTFGRFVGFFWGLAFATLALSFVVALKSESEIGLLLRDPAATFQYPPYAGFVSYVGVMIMVATTSILALSGMLSEKVRLTFASVALFSVIVALDDLFMFHEIIGPDLLGISEVAVLASYCVGGAVVAWLTYRHAGNRLPLLFILSGLFLASSMAMDQLVRFRYEVLLEDALKLIGYATWAAFWCSEAYASLSRRGGME